MGLLAHRIIVLRSPVPNAVGEYTHPTKNVAANDVNRMSISALLDQTLTMQRQTITRDGSGAAVRTFATILANVACAVSPAGASVVSDYARRDVVVTYHVFTSADLDTLVTGGARIGDRLTDGARVYLVKAVKKSANSLVSAEPLYQLDCELID